MPGHERAQPLDRPAPGVRRSRHGFEAIPHGACRIFSAFSAWRPCLPGPCEPQGLHPRHMPSVYHFGNDRRVARIQRLCGIAQIIQMCAPAFHPQDARWRVSPCRRWRGLPACPLGRASDTPQPPDRFWMMGYGLERRRLSPQRTESHAACPPEEHLGGRHFRALPGTSPPGNPEFAQIPG